MKTVIKTVLVIVPALLVYSYFAEGLDFTQDDAYISYRYVANYLNGDGLVFNIGERIEGYTNFGWVIYLLLWGALGMSFMVASKVTGFVFGAGVIIVTWLIARLFFREADEPFGWLAVFMVGVNQSLAYWSPAGLETAVFSFFTLLSLYLFLRRNHLMAWSLVMAVLLRPEGVLVAALLIVIETIDRRGWPRFSMTGTAIAFLSLVPLAVFKILYYGSVLPNPFYAKTAFGLEQLTAGLKYTEIFLAHYGFYGAGLILPLLYFRRWPRWLAGVWIFTVVYVMYVVVVGGDVLKVHRFFLPVIVPFALLTAATIWLVTRKLGIRTRYLILLLVAAPLLYMTVKLPGEHVHKYNLLEKVFTNKMRFKAEQLAATDSTNFSVAVPTIGILGYELVGHRVIDMVGLTDSTIARHPAEPIEGMATTWRERKHNSRYLLSQAPDYIIFSTGVKPSAPAEKSLLLYPQFLDSYRSLGWVHYNDTTRTTGTILSIFKRFRDIEGELEPTYPLAFVEHYKFGLEFYTAGIQDRAIEEFERAIALSPEPPYIYLMFHRALSYRLLGQHMTAIGLLDSVVARDSLVYMAHTELYKYAALMGQMEKAKVHRKWLVKLVPWYVARVDGQVQLLLEAAVKQQSK